MEYLVKQSLRGLLIFSVLDSFVMGHVLVASLLCVLTLMSFSRRFSRLVDRLLVTIDVWTMRHTGPRDYMCGLLHKHGKVVTLLCKCRRNNANMIEWQRILVLIANSYAARYNNYVLMHGRIIDLPCEITILRMPH